MNAPRIFIPTKNRARTITTPRATAFLGSDYTVLVHDSEQREAYIAAGRVDPRRVVVTGVPGDTYGLTRQREWVLGNMVEPGEWIVFADDNVHQVLAVQEPYWHDAKLPVTETPATWSARYKTLAGPKDWMRFVFESMAMADKIGAHLVGCATTDNSFFRGTKYRSVGYVSGKLMLWKNDPGYVWDHTVSMEDFRNTAEHLLRYGCVLVNNYVYPEAGHYEPGGMGTKLERMAIREEDVIHLREMYPGLFRAKERDGKALDIDLGLRYTTREQIEKWRSEMASGSVTMDWSSQDTVEVMS